MASRCVIQATKTEARFPPIGKYTIYRSEECINCGKCSKLCIYEVHGRSKEDIRIMAEPVHYLCRGCFRCVQECPAGVLSLAINKEYKALGDDLYTPEVITSLMKQAESGEIPVSGTGYGVPFAGEGFDGMWTDMSEIVRPTRDGIHGREYISTSIDLGRKPPHVRDIKFDEYGNPLTNIPPNVEIKLPIIFDRLPFSPPSESILLALSMAAAKLSTFVILEEGKISHHLLPYSNHIIRIIPPENLSERRIEEIAQSGGVIELLYNENVIGIFTKIKQLNPDLIVFIRVDASPDIQSIVEDLCIHKVEVIHIEVNPYPAGPDRKLYSLPEIMLAVHNHLVEKNLRDAVTLITSGEIAQAEHVPKTIILGADGVAIDVPTLIALECTVCKECAEGRPCPRDLGSIDPDWGAQRIINLMASWHNQLLEVLGAMGLREVSRLRGELGRVMFKKKLDEEIFAPIFRGEREIYARVGPKSAVQV